MEGRPPEKDSCCDKRSSRGKLGRIFAIIFHKRKGGDPCVYLPEKVSNRPDPCIYAQFFLMQLGHPVTWDNPDVSIFLNGVEQYTYDLKVDTEYDVWIKVHNSSKDKPAIGTNVDVRWIEFGAGGQIRHAIANLNTDVGVWPATSIVQTKWRTPATPGHYCIEVQLTHPNDANPANNLGWNNTQVFAAASEVRKSVRIFNRWVNGPPKAPRSRQALKADSSGESRTWNLVEITFDSYQFHDEYGRDVDPGKMFAERPPAWPARVEPHLFHFAPDETYRDVTLIVDAPDGPGQPERFNVTARQGGVPLGGVTVTVTRK
jgi:hypothetical protein